MDFTTIITIILPVFGLIAAGYVARRFSFLSENAGEGLSDYVFGIAIPLLLFRTMADGEIPDVSPWGLWASYFTAVAAVWLMAMAVIVFALKRDGRTGVVAGFTTGQANSVLVGIPLVIAAYGEEGAVPLALLLTINFPLMITLAAVLMEIADKGRPSFETLRKAARSIVTHPIIIGITSGVAWRLLGLPTEGLFRPVLDALADTAGPCALFALGIALVKYGIAGDWRATATITLLKLLAAPAIVWVLATHVFDLPIVWIGSLVLIAACPCGVNAYLIAQHYGTGIRMASSSVAVSTAIASLTCAFWLLIVPH